jgi:DtxR family transcriptional regulator, Mn-dependent transcriptional regulator
MRTDRGCCDLSASTEDYLKALFHLQAETEHATTSTLADRVGVSPASASAMLRRLRESGLVSGATGRRVALTEHGRRHALRVVRRHRLVETLLAEILDMPWDEVHAEAEILEHVLSPALEDRIAARLGHPTHDPHGDPIPPRDGDHDEAWPEPLVQAPVGSRFRVERVSDRDSAALRYLDRLGVRPGARLTVGERDPFGGPQWVEIEGRREALGGPLARIVHGTIEGMAEPS